MTAISLQASQVRGAGVERLFKMVTAKTLKNSSHVQRRKCVFNYPGMILHHKLQFSNGQIWLTRNLELLVPWSTAPTSEPYPEDILLALTLTYFTIASLTSTKNKNMAYPNPRAQTPGPKHGYIALFYCIVSH